jgi:ubiquinone/menaquinone biosynthesis C-methylase UbiE
MSFYESYILPHVIDLSCGTKPVRRQRQKVVPHAVGRVLEIGIGSGLNLPYYDSDRVELVWGLEPSEGMRRKAAPRLVEVPFEVRWLELPGEEIPLDDDSADTVVLTYTLCTIPDFRTALGQMRRVLKPGGKLLFSEHGAAPDAKVRQWQDRLNPIWMAVAGGCNLNREVPGALAEAGFKVQELDTMYVPGTPKVAAYTYWGYATLR